MNFKKRVVAFLIAIMCISMLSSTLVYAQTNEPLSTSENSDNLIGLLGDADLSGIVNIKDATEIQKIAAQLVTANEKQKVLCDVDGNGISITDATWIQKYCAEIDCNGISIGEPIYDGEIPTPPTTSPSSQPVTTTPSTTAPTESQPTTQETTVAQRNPVIAYAQADKLYAHGVGASSDASEDAWTKWEKFGSAYYVFLPVSSSSKYVEIFNGYNKDIKINTTLIPAKQSVAMEYLENQKYSVTGAISTNLIFKKSTTEGALYINTTNIEGSYDSSQFAWLQEDKANYCSGKYVIADGSGYSQSGVVKKLKGRGNTTWDKVKKPFNITFNETINLSGLEGKKFSLLANYQDSAFMRNRILYDMADEVGLPYSADSRFVDVYVNGGYQGTYQLSDKVELGKNNLIALKDNASETQTSDFNFCIEFTGKKELDDVYVTTSRGNLGVLKGPEPDAATVAGAAQLDFIKQKYQLLESALYSGNLESIKEIADVDSLAKMYIINEMSKNVDGGYTSTYFTYDAEKGIFIATPIWDFDCAIGNLFDSAARYSIEKTDGFYTKNVGRGNILYMFITAKGAESIVKDIWEKDFVPAISLINGTGTSSQQGNQRLMSMSEYSKLLGKTLEMNYMMWPYAVKDSTAVAGPDDNKTSDSFNWIPDQSKLTFYNADMTTVAKKYSLNYSDSINFVNDWLTSRANWLSNYYAGVSSGTEQTVQNYYVSGTPELTGSNWAIDDVNNKMTYDEINKLYYKTYSLDNGTYSFKIVPGSWEVSWGYDFYTSGETLGNYLTVTTKGLNNNVTLTVSNSPFPVNFKIYFDNLNEKISIELL